MNEKLKTYLIILLICLSACSTERKIFGTYIYSYPPNYEQLILLPNGTFVQIYSQKDTTIVLKPNKYTTDGDNVILTGYKYFPKYGRPMIDSIIYKNSENGYSFLTYKGDKIYFSTQLEPYNKYERIK